MTSATPDIEERLVLGELFAGLMSRSDWSSLPRNSLVTLKEQIYKSTSLAMQDAEELRAKLRSDPPGSIHSGRFILLPASSKSNILCALAISLENTVPNFRLYLRMFSLDDKQPQVFGIRFESPETPGEGIGGAHNFFHAQHFQSSIPGCEDAINTNLYHSQPSYPLDTDTWVGLAVCVLISVYGARETSELLKRLEIRGLQPYVNKLHAMR